MSLVCSRVSWRWVSSVWEIHTTNPTIDFAYDIVNPRELQSNIIGLYKSFEGRGLLLQGYPFSSRTIDKGTNFKYISIALYKSSDESIYPISDQSFLHLLCCPTAPLSPWPLPSPLDIIVKSPDKVNNRAYWAADKRVLLWLAFKTQTSKLGWQLQYPKSVKTA